MVPFIKLAYLSNLTLHNNHFMTEIRTLKSKSPANTEIKVIFHHRLIQIALSCNSASENSRKAAQTISTHDFVIYLWGTENTTSFVYVSVEKCNQLVIQHKKVNNFNDALLKWAVFTHSDFSP